MATLSLVLTLTFLAIVFPVRSLRRKRRFGSAGRATYSRRRPGLWWLADLLFLAGFGLVVAGPTLEMAGAVGLVWETGAALIALAVVAIFLAACLAVWSQELMGHAWRPDISPAEGARLVTSGPFRVVRNPNYLAMLVVAGGSALIAPTFVSFAGLLLLLAGLSLTIRTEEPLLIDRYGRPYLDYAAKTGRLLPGIGSIRGEGHRSRQS